MSEVKRVPWKDAYRIGSETVDTQHRRLFELASMLADLHEGGRDPDLVAYAVDQLYSYIRIHFADEEALMEAVGFAGREDHIRQHDRFILDFDDLVAARRNDEDFVPVLLAFLNRWLIHHIIEQDTRITAG